MLSFFDIQMAVYMAKQQLDPYAEALSDLVKYTKIDTKKQGKTVPEQMHYKKGFDDLFGEHSKHKNRGIHSNGEFTGEICKTLVRILNLSF